MTERPTSIASIEGEPTSTEEEAAIWVVNEIGKRFNEKVHGGAAVPATERSLMEFNSIITDVVREAIPKFGLIRPQVFRARAVYTEQGNRLTIHLSPFLEAIIYGVKVREEDQKRMRASLTKTEVQLASRT